MRAEILSLFKAFKRNFFYFLNIFQKISRIYNILNEYAQSK